MIPQLRASSPSIRCNSAAGSLALFLIALSLVSVFVAQVRDEARKHYCQNNLKELALALHNYHSAYKQLPLGAGGTSGYRGYPPTAPTDKRSSNQGRLSGFAGLTPFMEQQAVWEQLTNRVGPDDSEFSKMGPSPSLSPEEYPLWAVQIDLFLCPADPALRVDYGLRSYMFNYGDGIESVGRMFDDGVDDRQLPKHVIRGTFAAHVNIKFRDIVDGMSNTAMVGESVIGVAKVNSFTARIARGVQGLANSPALAMETVSEPEKAYRPDQALWGVGKGSRWAEGFYLLNGFTTVLPPGGPSATMAGDPESGVVSASSYHVDGVNVAMSDGAIRFVSRFIDTGDSTAPCISPKNTEKHRPSPYGVWGAMGTRAQKEIIPSEREAKFKTMR
ncbi:DUF1559 domain-containing protein [Rhodopirellula bahusiensis]|uniref:DUF1559 domain-containing protein n=1 Tax=Rhodopirellula bahusiensis TaxID=2014065 RepID=UPI003262FAA3